MITAVPITRAGFAPFGEVIETGNRTPQMINAGLCARYTDLARFDVQDGRAGLSLFQSQLRALPYACDLLERHPLGSQCFVPMSQGQWLLIVAPDADGVPGEISAFVADGTQGVNIARNTWHSVLAPVSGSGLFAVIDRIGDGANLQEHQLAQPVMVTLPATD